MKHATLADLKEIYAQFQKRKDIFPFKRQDKLKREIAAGQVIWQDGVVIVWQRYKKRTRVGDVQIPAGSVMLHQILNSDQGNGKGSMVFEDFVAEVVLPFGGDMYLSVREENMIARQFYDRHGMKIVGSVAWSNGTLPGLIYKLTSSEW